MPSNNSDLEKRLWEAADQLRANSGLKSSEYSTPVLGLIFLKYADFKFSNAKEKLEKESKGGRAKIGKLNYQAKGVLYIPEKASYNYLLSLPEGSNIGSAVNAAMKLIEEENTNLAGVLPKNYTQFENDVLVALVRNFAGIPMDVEGDVFGKIYEYFLGEFAMAEGQKGGEFFTPTSIVKLIVEILEPFKGKILDPACGSGGMFVQSAKFVAEHKKNPSSAISIYGEEKQAETIRLCKMNLAVHGLEGDVKQGNTYYEDVHKSLGKFDFVLANPPFNVNGIDKEKIKTDKRFCYGLPRTDNGNYLWIQLFWSTLNENGRAGFVMANSASDARQSEQDIRKALVDDNGIDVMISVSSNFFYTVTLPCTLWFLDKGKIKTKRKGKVLFIDARNIFTQVDRAHREYTPVQIQFIANIARLYREEEVDLSSLGEMKDEWKNNFPKNKYADISGLCKVATLEEIKEQNYSINPGRYVGVIEKAADDFDFYEKLEELNEELEVLNAEAMELEEKINDNIIEMLNK
ncbi:MAG: type I restriction-modification system subunit M [Ignavibacteriaceae bacterium]|nr:type I restriction-modification system subunit M [Ignavibacteriaceae bacterium]